MSDDHKDSGWRKRQIALDQKAENARELGLDYEIHSCSPFCTLPLCVAVREAVQAEREALCIAMEDQNTWDLYDPAATAIQIIKARGQA